MTGPLRRVSLQDVSPELTEAVRVLRDGGLVAFPTETVYGLGAAARNEAAVARIFAAKGRPTGHPLIVHLAAAEQVEAWARAIPPEAHRLMERFWPGPLTLILDRRPDVPDAITGGQPTIGLRVPDHPLAARLLEAFGDGIAAPSANRFGSVSPTTAAHVALELGTRLDLILDGGSCRVGVESTIVRVDDAGTRLLRPGGVPRELLEDVLGARVADADPNLVRAPGTLASHYAPRARVVAVARGEVGREVGATRLRAVVLGPEAIEGHPHIELSRDPARAATQLYAALREVDTRGYELAVVALPDPSGIGEAVADRIRRAAAPRPRDSG